MAREPRPTSARATGSALGLLARRPLASVAVAFAFSRACVLAAGVRFDAVPLAGFWQFIDPALLRGDLWRSVAHLHSQPPLFNLFLAGVLHGFPGSEVLAFQAIYLVVGLALALSLCALMLRLGVPRGLAVLLAILYTVGPPAILHENWLFYDYPVAALLCLGALWVHRFAARARLRDGVALFALLASVALVRSLFHPVWLALVVAMVAVAQRRHWRRVLAAAAVPCLAVLAWYGKNLWLFGSFVGSTWLGMNFSDITTLKIPREERAALVSQGVLSPFALIPSFRALDAYRPYLPERPPTGIAVLDQERKPSGAPNFNHRAYIDVARRYRRDALVVLRTRPRAYLDGLGEAWLRHFVPASDHDWLAANRLKIREWDRLYAVALCGRFRDDVWPKSPEVIDPRATWSLGRKLLNTGLFLLVACPLLFVYGLVAARRARARGEGPAFVATLVFLCFTIAYVTVVGNALEVGENFRNRFTLAPFYVTLLGLFLTARWPRARGQSGSAV